MTNQILHPQNLILLQICAESYTGYYLVRRNIKRHWKTTPNLTTYPAHRRLPVSAPLERSYFVGLYRALQAFFPGYNPESSSSKRFCPPTAAPATYIQYFASHTSTLYPWRIWSQSMVDLLKDGCIIIGQLDRIFVSEVSQGLLTNYKFLMPRFDASYN